ncbi:MAG: hypothetical protein QMD94_01995 [Candidatus Omnitrophota bacterium]|nr:hypothetical protein [Candidatus Omnitrophota bacterium]
MFSEKVFQIALIISLTVHGVVLFQNLNFSISPKAKTEQRLELRYIKNPPKIKRDTPKAALKKEPFLKCHPKIRAEFKAPPQEDIFKKANTVISQRPIFIKPELMKTDIIAVKKKISLPAVALEKINNPAYISYYQIVREKIKRAAYQNYTRNETGEVYISFIISSFGELKNIQLIEEKSSPSMYLRDVALRSLSDTSGFPAFPKELDYPQLSFNVIISFEIE